MTLQLKTETRKVFGKKLKDSRVGGRLPAVVYGRDKENKNIFVDLKEFKKIWEEAGESTIVELLLPTPDVGESSMNVLVHEVAIDPINNEPLHVDFLAVDMDRVVIASVPLVFEGISPAVKNLGGMLVKVMHEVEIEALPNDLPHEIKVDISSLKTFEDQITIGNLNLPNNVKSTQKAEEVIVLAELLKEETEETVAPDFENIEVEKKGKKAAEGEPSPRVEAGRQGREETAESSTEASKKKIRNNF